MRSPKCRTPIWNLYSSVILPIWKTSWTIRNNLGPNWYFLKTMNAEKLFDDVFSSVRLAHQYCFSNWVLLVSCVGQATPSFPKSIIVHVNLHDRGECCLCSSYEIDRCALLLLLRKSRKVNCGHRTVAYQKKRWTRLLVDSPIVS